MNPFSEYVFKEVEIQIPCSACLCAFSLPFVGSQINEKSSAGWVHCSPFGKFGAVRSCNAEL